MNFNNDIVVALDIGTTKVCCIAGRKNEYGKIEILGVGKVESAGVLRGVVSNIEKTVKAISDAVQEAERKAGTSIKVVNVGIAGQHIKSLQHRGILMRDSMHDEISQKDITRLINDMHKLVLPPGDKIIHVIPQEYIVDNEQGIIDPIGMSGVRLEANFHIVTGQITASKNLYKCIEKAGLQVASLTLEPIASATAVLSDEEKEAGVALVDIGGGTTDLAIFHEGIIRHTAVIPFGGNVVTKDIKEGCTVMQNQAELLKVKFGAALAEELHENRVITIPGLQGREHKEISERNLAMIIQARLEEIIDHIYWEIRRSGYERKLIGGIVLTGGGSLMRYVDKLVEFQTGMPTRIGIPIDRLAHGYNKELCSPMYSTAIGLLLKGISDVENGIRPIVEKTATTAENKKTNLTDTDEKTTTQPTPEPSVSTHTNAAYHHQNPDEAKWHSQLFRRVKEWFEAEPDKEL
jgi:cell division protein FtsA